MKTMELTNLRDFNLEHIFECGQCFRWKKCKDESYTGIIKNGVVNIKMQGKEQAVLKYEFLQDDPEVIYQYFDLNRDYSVIKSLFSKEDVNMKEAMQYGEGIRILKQDPWEMIVSYIISAANNIPRISKTIENIARAYGKKIIFEGEEYFLFPSPEELSKASIGELRELNLGFRDKYVYEATQLVVSKQIDLEKIKQMKYPLAKQELMKLNGVGEKVADCILLFSMDKMEAFPIDTWIRKVMTELYGTPNTVKDIKICAQTKFGTYAGIAQQYLFYYMRENN